MKRSEALPGSFAVTISVICAVMAAGTWQAEASDPKPGVPAKARKLTKSQLDQINRTAKPAQRLRSKPLKSKRDAPRSSAGSSGAVSYVGGSAGSAPPPRINGEN